MSGWHEASILSPFGEIYRRLTVGSSVKFVLGDCIVTAVVE